jgi:hypothetical protein
MKLYDNNPQSKAMQSLIHDSRNCGDTIRFHISKLQDRLKEINAVDTKSFVHLQFINSKTIEIEKAIDAYYERFSQDFPENENSPYEPEVINAYTLTIKLFNAEKWDKEMLPTYNLIKKLMEDYTLIRKPISEPNPELSVATDDDSSTDDGNPKNKML